MRIIIVGAGFAGMAAAKKLNKTAQKKDIEVVLIDKNSYSTFVPLLPDYTGEMTTKQMIKREIKEFLPENIEFRQEDVISIDFDNKKLESNKNSYDYDFLILASGSVVNYFGLKTDSKIYPLTSYNDAVDILDKFVSYINLTINPVVVISGAGYTGIELASHLKQTAEHHKKQVEIILLEKNNRILAFLSKKQQQYVQKYLDKEGFKLFLETELIGYDGNEAVFSDGAKIKTDLVCWTTGTKSPMTNIEGGFSTLEDGRIVVDEFLRVSGYEDTFIAGDSAAIKQKDNYIRKAVNFAIYSGERAALNIKRLVENKSLKKFYPPDLGWMLPLGQTSVGKIFGIFEVYGKTGMRLHYLMGAFRCFDSNSRWKYILLALTMRDGKMTDRLSILLKVLFKSTEFRQYGYLALRIIFGMGFVYHGMSKLVMGLDSVVSMFAILGIPAAAFFAPLVAFTELTAGMIMLVGLFTRISSIAIMTIMFVALITAHAGVSYADPLKQLTILYFFVGLLYFLGGGGGFSVDRVLYRNLKKQIQRPRLHI